MSSVPLAANARRLPAQGAAASACPPYGASVASESEYRAAIARVRHNPKNASRSDWELVEQAAKQAGSLGNDARAALSGR